jgi:hypothetical protein
VLTRYLGLPFKESDVDAPVVEDGERGLQTIHLLSGERRGVNREVNPEPHLQQTTAWYCIPSIPKRRRDSSGAASRPG